jgi:hypothetical protein
MKKTFLIFFVAFFTVIKAQSPPATDTIYANSWEESRERTFGLLPKTHYPSGYLLNQGIFSLRTLLADGKLNDSTFNMLDWYAVQNAVRSSYYTPDSLKTYLEIDSLKEDYIAKNDVLPWGLIDMNIHRIRDSALIDGSLIVKEYRLEELTDDLSKIYFSSRLFCAAPLNLDVYTFNPTFILKSDFIISNNTSGIISIEIDAGDGLGYRAITIDIPFSVDFTEEGYKQFITRIAYGNGDTLYNRSELYVYDPGYARAAAEENTTYDYVHIIRQDGLTDHDFSSTYPSEFDEPFHTENEVRIGFWWGCGNTSRTIRKPFVIFGGYNPKEGKTLDGNTNAPWINDNFGPLLSLAGWRGPLYETYNGFFTSESKDASHHFGNNGNEFLNKIKQEGYDILIVQFVPGIKYLQNNAFLCAKVINYVNDQMKNNPVYNPGADLDPEDPQYPNSTSLKKAQHEIVVAGYSAGGLSGRLGLLMMEYQHENNKCAPASTAVKYPKHRVKTFIGIDSENQGSIVPIGFQMFLEFEASWSLLPANNGDIFNSIICRSALKLIREHGIATQNTLYGVDQLSYQGNSNWLVGHHSDFDDYYEDLTDVSVYNPANLTGYPKDCYRISVSQGSANGSLQNLIGNGDIIDNESPSPFCQSPLGTIYGVGAPGITATPYRKAEARAITYSNNNAFSCKKGIYYRVGTASWYTYVADPKYHDNNWINDQYVGNAQPYDITAASMLPSHKLISQKLYLSQNSYAMAAFRHCNYINYNPKAHGFCPTPSALDLHLPGQNTLPRLPNLSLSPTNMNMLFQNNYSNPSFIQSPNFDFGFPHLTYPINHYDYTPYDAIWANGTHDQTLYDENLIHVEDPSPHIGEFLTEEIAPYTLYLSNRTIKGESCPLLHVPTTFKYYADFEARNSVLAGNQSIYQHNQNSKYPRVRTSEGDFVIDNGGVVTIRANNDDLVSSVVLGAGFSSKYGSILRAYVYYDPNTCPPANNGQLRAINEPESPKIIAKNARSIIATHSGSTQNAANDKKKDYHGIGPFPNPTDGTVYYAPKNGRQLQYVISDLIGRELANGYINEYDNQINLSEYKAGIYFITILGEGVKQTDRIILQE